MSMKEVKGTIYRLMGKNLGPRPAFAGQANRRGTDGDGQGHLTRPSSVHQKRRHRREVFTRCAQGFQTT